MRAATEHRVGTADASTTLGPLVGTCCYLLQASALPRFSSSRRVPSSFASESNQPILRPQPFDFPFEGSFDSRSIHHRNPACLRVCVVLATRKQDDTTHSTPQNSSLSHQAFSPSRPFTCLPTPSIKLPSTCARSSELTRQAAPLPHHHHHHHLAAPGRIGTNWRDKKKKKKEGRDAFCMLPRIRKRSKLRPPPTACHLPYLTLLLLLLLTSASTQPVTHPYHSHGKRATDGLPFPWFLPHHNGTFGYLRPSTGHLPCLTLRYRVHLQHAFPQHNPSQLPTPSSGSPPLRRAKVADDYLNIFELPHRSPVSSTSLIVRALFISPLGCL